MNKVLRESNGSLCSVSIWRDGDAYRVSTTCFWPDGSLRCVGSTWRFGSLRDAKQKVRSWVKTKRKRCAAEAVRLRDTPREALRYLAPDLENQVTPEQLVRLMEQAENERYVVFKDVNGMDEWFDEGVEYVAEDLGDEDFIRVYDRYGDSRDVLTIRLASVRKTEATEELARVKGVEGVGQNC